MRECLLAILGSITVGSPQNSIRQTMVRGVGKAGALRAEKKSSRKPPTRKRSCWGSLSPELAGTSRKTLSSMDQVAPKANTKAAIRKRLQASSKPERAAKRRAFMEERQDAPRFVGQTLLEQEAVSTAVGLDYARRHQIFLQFAQDRALSLQTAPKCDESFSVFLNFLFAEGLDITEGSKHFAAMLDACPALGHKSQLPRSRRCLQGWTKLDPGCTRPPIPFPLIALMATTMCKNHHVVAAVAILTMFVAYLRPGEAL